MDNTNLSRILNYASADKRTDTKDVNAIAGKSTGFLGGHRGQLRREMNATQQKKQRR